MELERMKRIKFKKEGEKGKVKKKWGKTGVKNNEKKRKRAPKGA